MDKKVKFSVSGMTCAACSAHVQKAVSSLPGVKEADVSLLTNSMVVSFDSSTSEEDICDAVKKAGYEAKASGTTDDKKGAIADEETPKLVRRLIASLVLLVPLFYFSMGYMNPGWGWPLGAIGENPFYYGVLAMCLSLVILLINHSFFVSGFRSLIHGGPNMDTLVSLGSGIAFVYGIVVLLLMSSALGPEMGEAGWKKVMTLSMGLTFETAGMVPTLITVGKTLESFSKGKTTNAIKSLLDLSPKEACVLRNGKEETILTEDVLVGDIFLVRPGEAIPVDGVVLEGESAVDESALSGESIPVDKKTNDRVSSGTINKNGALRCKATQVGSQTTLQQIVKMVEDASMSKAKISQIADRVSGIFVPAVLLVALIVLLGWLIFGGNYVNGAFHGETKTLTYALERCVSVLVVACPCALGLATPVAIMVGSGKGAKNGILFKTASALEETGKIDFVLIDKTGTLTKGAPDVTDIIPFGEHNSDELLSLAYSLETSSEHPLAKAIVEKGKEKGIAPEQITSFKAISGAGVSGLIGNDICYGGKVALFEDKLRLDSKTLDVVVDLSNEGKTPLLFAKGNDFCGVIAVSDSLKEDSKEAVKEFKNLGLIPVMLTGDNLRTATHVAKEVGIKYVKADLLPGEKLEFVESLKKIGRVAMIGDGINDAPSLTAADIGIAIGAGSDIAIDSADVVLMKGTLRDASAAIRLSRHTLLNIKENLFWAFFYNLIMIPVSAGVFSGLGLAKLKPWYGAAAMALSSVSVVCNALRINLFDIYKNYGYRRKVKINLGDVDKLLSAKKEGTIMKKEIVISGMMCEHCAAHVKSALESVAGVKSVQVILADKKAIVETDGNVENSLLSDAVIKAGYKVVSISD